MALYGFKRKETALRLSALANQSTTAVPFGGYVPPRHVQMFNDTETTIERGDVLYGPSESGGVRQRSWHNYDIVTSVSGAENDAKSLCVALMDIPPDGWGHVAVNGWCPAKTSSGSGYWGMPDAGKFKKISSGMVRIGAAVTGETDMHWVNLDMAQPLWRVSVGESSNTLKDWAGVTYATSEFIIEDPDSFFTGSDKLYVQHMIGRGMYFAAIAGNCPPPPE